MGAVIERLMKDRLLGIHGVHGTGKGMDRALQTRRSEGANPRVGSVPWVQQSSAISSTDISSPS